MLTFEQFKEWALNQGIPEKYIPARYEQYVKSHNAQRELMYEID